MPVTYRRARGSDTWHFREDCRSWPEVGFEEEASTPSYGVCCTECTYWPASNFSRFAHRNTRPLDQSVPTEHLRYGAARPYGSP
jgi:hypothetical protein